MISDIIITMKAIISKTIIVIHKHFAELFFEVLILPLHRIHIKPSKNIKVRTTHPHVIKKNIFPAVLISSHGISAIPHIKNPIDTILHNKAINSMLFGFKVVRQQ
jgi:hypothetical protein